MPQQEDPSAPPARPAGPDEIGRAARGGAGRTARPLRSFRQQGLAQTATAFLGARGGRLRARIRPPAPPARGRHGRRSAPPRWLRSHPAGSENPDHPLPSGDPDSRRSASSSRSPTACRCMRAPTAALVNCEPISSAHSASAASGVWPACMGGRSAWPPRRRPQPEAPLRRNLTLGESTRVSLAIRPLVVRADPFDLLSGQDVLNDPHRQLNVLGDQIALGRHEKVPATSRRSGRPTLPTSCTRAASRSIMLRSGDQPAA